MLTPPPAPTPAPPTTTLAPHAHACTPYCANCTGNGTCVTCIDDNYEIDRHTKQCKLKSCDNLGKNLGIAAIVLSGVALLLGGLAWIPVCRRKRAAEQDTDERGVEMTGIGSGEGGAESNAADAGKAGSVPKANTLTRRASHTYVPVKELQF